MGADRAIQSGEIAFVPFIPDHPIARARSGLAVVVIPAILALMTQDRINLHLVSDATGETLNSIARATVAQFDAARFIYHRWSLIRTRRWFPMLSILVSS